MKPEAADSFLIPSWLDPEDEVAPAPVKKAAAPAEKAAVPAKKPAKSAAAPVKKAAKNTAAPAAVPAKKAAKNAAAPAAVPAKNTVEDCLNVPENISVSVKNVWLSYIVAADRSDSVLRTVRRGFRSQEGRHVTALRGVSFDLYRGDALGLIGHNGAGKSTLLQAIAGLLRPSRGSVGVAHQPHILGVAAALDRKLSGRRNIELGCLAQGIAPARVERLSEAIIDFTGLGDFIDLPVRTYSSGMRQRLGFAIATVEIPDILLIDEALAVGDKEFKKASLDRLNEVRAGAGVVVLATHSMHEVRRTCNKALWLHEGSQVRFGDPEEVIEAYESRENIPERRL